VTILGADRRPVENLEVLTRGPDRCCSPRWNLLAETDAEGTVRLPAPREGRWDLRLDSGSIVGWPAWNLTAAVTEERTVLEVDALLPLETAAVDARTGRRLEAPVHLWTCSHVARGEEATITCFVDVPEGYVAEDLERE